MFFLKTFVVIKVVFERRLKFKMAEVCGGVPETSTLFYHYNYVLVI